MKDAALPKALTLQDSVKYDFILVQLPSVASFIHSMLSLAAIILVNNAELDSFLFCIVVEDGIVAKWMM